MLEKIGDILENSKGDHCYVSIMGLDYSENSSIEKSLMIALITLAESN